MLLLVDESTVSAGRRRAPSSATFEDHLGFPPAAHPDPCRLGLASGRVERARAPQKWAVLVGGVEPPANKGSASSSRSLGIEVAEDRGFEPETSDLPDAQETGKRESDLLFNSALDHRGRRESLWILTGSWGFVGARDMTRIEQGEPVQERQERTVRVQPSKA